MNTNFTIIGSQDNTIIVKCPTGQTIEIPCRIGMTKEHRLREMCSHEHIEETLEEAGSPHCPSMRHTSTCLVCGATAIIDGQRVESRLPNGAFLTFQEKQYAEQAYALCLQQEALEKELLRLRIFADAEKKRAALLLDYEKNNDV